MAGQQIVVSLAHLQHAAEVSWRYRILRRSAVTHV